MVGIKNNSPGAYEQDRELAHHEDPKVRLALAERQDVRPEILYFLAEDPDPEVRRKIAANQAAPRQADLMLARDEDTGVRGDLAGKIARVVPGLSPKEQKKLYQSTYGTLEVLALDQITRVRRIMSEALKDVANAPPGLIKKLAQDTEIEVAGPVLEFSPVLSDEDLLEIIDAGPAKGGLGAVARRTNVGEKVADTIAATDDIDAIADLLSNDSAQIREETLDSLVERAPGINLWHAPLVGRSKLSSKAATQMARFVADNLLESLQARSDLDSETLDAVKSVVRHRIDESQAAEESKLSDTMTFDDLKVPPPTEVVKRLSDAGRLDENIIAKALHASDYAFVLAGMVVLSGLTTKVARTIFSAHSAKGVVALAWKGGLSMKLAFLIQQRMAGIPPNEVLAPMIGKDYPLNVDEMNWQIEYFTDLSEKSSE